MIKETEGTERRSTAEAWQEVSRQIEALGKSLDAALWQAWNDGAMQKAVGEMESGLQSIARAVAEGIDQAAALPEGQQLREDAERAAESARVAGEEAVAEARPKILAALQSIHDGLEKAIEQLQGTRPSASESDRPPEAE